jgi:ACS family tartrate transporter-like MFS transporter
VHSNRWFPKRERARALALFLMASPIALAIGGPIAGMILRWHYFNLPGWRWVFIAEGVPAILLGFITLYVMTDRPEQAKWLQAEERDWLLGELEAEKRQKATLGHFTVWQAIRHPTVLVLAAIIGLANIGIQGFFLWLPTTVHKASGLNPSLSAVVSGLPFAVAVVAVLITSWSSDRTGDRIFHCAIPLILSGFIFPITTISGLSFGWLLFWLCASSAAIYAFGPTFWVLPTLTMGESAGAAALGFVNCFSGVGGFIGPTVVGAILTLNHSYTLAVLFLSFCFLAAGLLTLSMRSRISGRRQAEAALETNAGPAASALRPEHI